MARSHCARNGASVTGERFHDGRMGGGVGDGRVARHRFHLAHRRAMRAPGQRFLDSAMLVAERDLQVQHFLARALETKVARLDDARMDRADGDFVNLAAARRGRNSPSAGAFHSCAAQA